MQGVQQARPQEEQAPRRTAPDSSPKYTPTRSSRKSSIGGKRNTIIFIVVAVIVALGLILGYLLGGASIIVHPKYKSVNVQGTFTAKTEPAAGELGYEVLTLEADAERQVTATGKEEVTEQAQGTITIYNEYSTNSVRLVKNTRFESSDGHIFRITESAVVPGYTGDGSNKTPGTIVAKVFADEAGPEYNVAAGKFTIPGFKGDPEFDAVYGKSSDAFTGGFAGQKYIVDDADLQKTKDVLHEELQAALRSRLESERPAGFVLYESAITFSYSSLPATESTDGMATIKEHGVLQIPIFENSEFAGYLAQNTIAGYENSPISITDPSTLTFTYSTTGSSTTAMKLSDQNEITFDIRGDAELVWTFDHDKLVSDLAGKSKTALPAILSGYPAIERAEATIRPFWKSSFPDKKDDIKLDIMIGDNG